MGSRIREPAVSTQWILPAESEEWVGPITVTLNGSPITTWQIAVVRNGQRPTTWADPDPLSGGLGVLIGPTTANVLTYGRHSIWIKVTDSPEVPVISDAGQIIIT
jgi:hypothetical protein